MKKKIKRRVRFDRIMVFFLVIIVIGISIMVVLNVKITNIYIKNNYYLTDQEIIEKANLSDYPATIKNLSFQIKQRLEKDNYIKEVKVYKKKFTKVYIEVIENRPLFYYNSENQTILLDGRTNELYSVPTVLNYITDTYFNDFIIEMGKLDVDVLGKISEIKFVPNEVDDNRFLLSMNDGNYVYVNIGTFNKLNKYLSIMESLPNEKGILYLDYGNNFEILK
ncbi:MAG: FtsQ-type POTRA domain-containing protein [Bacilli bacterium]